MNVTTEATTPSKTVIYAKLDEELRQGFGDAALTCDGVVVWNQHDGLNQDWPTPWGDVPREATKWLTFKDAEVLAAADPNRAWKAYQLGPHTRYDYERKAPGQWVGTRSKGFMYED